MFSLLGGLLVLLAIGVGWAAIIALKFWLFSVAWDFVVSEIKR